MTTETTSIVPQNVVSPAMLARVKRSLTEHLKEEIISVNVYGSRLRGYSDIAADHDFVVLTRLPNKDYFNVIPQTQDPEKRKRQEELAYAEQKRINELVSEDVGTKVAITCIDERKAIIGLLNFNPNIVGAVHILATGCDYVREHLMPLFDKYLSLDAMSSRYIEVARYQISRLRAAGASQIYRQERNYLTAMWCLLRCLEFINEDRENLFPAPNMQLLELIRSATANNSEECPVLKNSSLVRPYYRRTGRERFADLEGISAEETQLLEDLFNQVSRCIDAHDFADYEDRATPDIIAEELLKMYVRNDNYFKAKQ